MITSLLCILTLSISPQTQTLQRPAAQSGGRIAVAPTAGGAQSIQPGGGIPPGSIILRETDVAPPGFTYAGLSLFAAAVSPSWSSTTSMPGNKAQASAVAANGKIYLVGGGPGPTPTTDLWEYDLQTLAWSPKPSMSTARNFPGAAVVNGKLYAFGGSGIAGYLNDGEVYDLATESWIGPMTAMPTARNEFATAVVNGKIYAVGGFNGSHLATCEEYDPAMNSWTIKTSMPTARGALAAGAVNGKIYAIGGGDYTLQHAAVEEYDPATNTWTSAKQPMPTARFALAAGVVNGRICVFGGYGGGAILGTVEEYDPGSNSWSTMASMSTVRWLLPGASVGGSVYAIGGSTTFGAVSSMEKLGLVSTLYAHRKN